MPGFLLKDICKKYKTAKLALLKALLELSQDQTNVANFSQNNVFELVKPFLSDMAPEVQNMTILLVTKIAERSEENASTIINSGIVSELMKDIWNKERYYQLNVLKALTTIGIYSECTADAVLKLGGLEFLKKILSSFDKIQLFHAVYAVGKLGSYPGTALKLTGMSGVLDSFHCLLNHTDVIFLRSVVSALGDIAFVSKAVAERMVDKAYEGVTKLIYHPNTQLKEKVLGAIARFAYHSAELSQEVLKTGILSEILHCLLHAKGRVTKYAIDAVIQISKHTEETAKTVISAGAVGIIKDVIKICENVDRRKCIELLGVMAKSSDTADSIEESEVVSALMSTLKHETDIELIISIVWTLGELGKKSLNISCKIANENFLQTIIQHVKSPQTSKCYAVFMNTYKSIFDNCVDDCVMRIFLTDDIEALPPPIVEHAAYSLALLLPFDAKARMKFLETGALKRLMCLQHIKTSSFTNNRQRMMLCYPENTIREMQLRLTREEGVAWDALAPYYFAEGASAAALPWIPRPLRLAAVDQRRLPARPATSSPEPVAVRREDLSLPGSRAAASSSSPEEEEEPTPSALRLPRLAPGELGPQPFRFSCPTCCEYLTPQEDPCCRELEEAYKQAGRVCHVAPQSPPHSDTPNAPGDADDEDEAAAWWGDDASSCVAVPGQPPSPAESEDATAEEEASDEAADEDNRAVVAARKRTLEDTSVLEIVGLVQRASIPRVRQPSEHSQASSGSYIPRFLTDSARLSDTSDAVEISSTITCCEELGRLIQHASSKASGRCHAETTLESTIGE